jgi:hypothetical protein
MASEVDLGLTIQNSDGDRPGATAAFPFDRMTVERFRKAFPQARWREDLRAWFVPGTTAARRLNRWLGRELSGVLAYADDKGRDAFTFDPIESDYLDTDEDLRIRTPYSRAIVTELRAVPWAYWDGEMKAWRVPFRSLEELRRHWPAIEAAGRRNEPGELRKRREARKAAPKDSAAAARAVERRRGRFPLPADALPRVDRIVMTRPYGAILITEIAGELVEEEVRGCFYPEVSAANGELIWGSWRKPTHDELVKAWPSRSPTREDEISRGWWQPTIEELRTERRNAKSHERARLTRRSKARPEQT